MPATQIAPRQTQNIAKASLSAQTTNNGDTYLSDTNVSLANVKAGTKIIWTFAITKTGAGTAAPAWNVRIGTAGTTSDTSRLAFTGSAQTAVIDAAYVTIEVVFRSVGSGTSAVVAGVYVLRHNLATTGFATIAGNAVTGVSGGFDSTVANLLAGVSVNSGASSAWTFVMKNVEVINPN